MAHRKLSVLLSVLIICAASVAQTPHPVVSPEQVKAAIEKAPKTRPGVLINAEQEKRIKGALETDPLLKALSVAIIKEADRLVGQQPLERIVTGRRLLSVSRECVHRMMCLGTAYRLTGDAKYFKQAEAEMLAVAAFTDWNPSHFLDTAEMTGAMGIGYDWFYAQLSDESKTTIRNAIIQKGLEASFKNDGWSRVHNNWNQVCNGGIGIGALALRIEEPEWAARVIHRAVTTIKPAMDEYEPDGAYPEGPGYWSYGTMYNVMLIAALDASLGTDFGLSTRSGFADSGDYYLHTTGPSGWFFNYADCGRGGGVSPTVFWHAQRYNKPYLLHQQLPQLRPNDNGEIATRPSWFFPMLLLWAQPEAAVPPHTCWMGRGITPVAIFRSSWTDPAAAYLAIKAGSASSNHAHMDAGSFVYEADGVRWALDLGAQDYHKMESRGLNIWDRRQSSQRWQIFRYSNFAHNTLTVNEQLHHANGVSHLVRFSDSAARPHAVIEMSDIFKDPLATAVRGAVLLPDRRALIQDECKAGDNAATVRWAMVVPGKIDILSPTAARLTEKGKTLLVEVSCPKGVQLKSALTTPPQEWDEPNPNTSILGFEVELAPQEEIRLAVVLTPGTAEKQALPALTPLMEWSAPLK
jgi:hypothetical protein